MNINSLDKNLSIVLKGKNKGRDILVVFDRVKRIYDYFFIEEDNLIEISKQEKIELKNIFEGKFKHINFIKFSPEAMKESEKTLKILQNCSSKIKPIISDLPKEQRTEINTKLNNSRIWTLNEYLEKFAKNDKDYFLNCEALYDTTNNIVAYTNNASTETLLHELLHLCSTSNDKTMSGFNFFGNGVALNEYFTEHLVKQSNSGHISGYLHYEIFDQWLAPLSNKLKTFYFQNDYFSAINEIANYYNINFEQADDLLLKADTLLRLTRSFDMFDDSYEMLERREMISDLLEDIYVKASQYIITKNLKDGISKEDIKIMTNNHHFMIFPLAKENINISISELIEDLSNEYEMKN